MRTKPNSKCLFGAMLLCGFSISAFPALAQQPRLEELASQEDARLQEIMLKFSTSGPGSLSAEELIDVHDLDTRGGADAESDIFFVSLVWSWTADRGIGAQASVAELVQAYADKHGSAPDRFGQQLSGQLVDLPTPGQGVYSPPPYVPTDVRFPRRRVYGLAPLPFGPIEKNALSRLSTSRELRHLIGR